MDKLQQEMNEEFENLKTMLQSYKNARQRYDDHVTTLHKLKLDQYTKAQIEVRLNLMRTNLMNLYDTIYDLLVTYTNHRKTETEIHNMICQIKILEQQNL